MMDKLFRKTKEQEVVRSKTEEEIIKDLETQRYPFDNEFKDFIRLSKGLDADKDMVDGKPREYVSTFSLIPRYKEAFGTSGIAESTMQYRISKINPPDYPEDFLIVQTEKSREAKYFINRLNIDLMKKIFMPSMGNEDFDEMVKNVQNQEDYLHVINDFALSPEQSHSSKKPRQEIYDEEYHDENEYLKNEKED